MPPTDKQATFVKEVPAELPVWGSIVDDIWAAEEVERGGAAVVGLEWLRRTDAEWAAMGHQSHDKKAIDGRAGEEVVQ